MLAIAKEMNQSETAFLMRSTTSDLKARYFTPECEIPLAGHPTIATIHAALEAGLLSSGAQEISLELRDGPIRVALEERSGRRLIKMFQRKPEFLQIHNPNDVLPIFGLNTSDLLSGAQIQTVSTGTAQLMVPLKDQESLRRLKMNDVESYLAYRKKTGFFSPHFFCLQGATAEGTTFARHLGAAPDAMEDAFTGSATGGMAAYLWKHGFLKTNKFIAEQGHWMGRPGKAFVEVIGPREDIDSVCVAGTAVTLVIGEMQL